MVSHRPGFSNRASPGIPDYLTDSGNLAQLLRDITDQTILPTPSCAVSGRCGKAETQPEFIVPTGCSGNVCCCSHWKCGRPWKAALMPLFQESRILTR